MGTPICTGQFPNCSSLLPHRTVFSPDSPIVTVRRASALPLTFSWPGGRERSGLPFKAEPRGSVPTLLQVHVPVPRYKTRPVPCPPSLPLSEWSGAAPPPGSLHPAPPGSPQGRGHSHALLSGPGLSPDPLACPFGLSPEFFLSLPSSPRSCSMGYLPLSSTPLPGLSPPPHATTRSLLLLLAQPVPSLPPLTPPLTSLLLSLQVWALTPFSPPPPRPYFFCSLSHLLLSTPDSSLSLLPFVVPVLAHLSLCSSPFFR